MADIYEPLIEMDICSISLNEEDVDVSDPAMAVMVEDATETTKEPLKKLQCSECSYKTNIKRDLQRNPQGLQVSV